MARNQRSRARHASKSHRQAAADPTPQRAGFEEIRELILTRPARALDRAIEAVREARGEEASTHLLDLIAKAVYAERGLEAATGDVVFNDLGRRKLKQADRNYVTAVLLRILAANPHALPDSVLRGYFRELIESLPDRLVAALNLPRDTLEHRIVELPGVVPAGEERVEQSFRALNGVDGMRSFQSDFLRALQSPFVSAAIRPFLPSHLVEGSFSALARAVDRRREGRKTVRFGSSCRLSAKTRQLRLRDEQRELLACRGRRSAEPVGSGGAGRLRRRQ
jgi:hypothetical protein